MKKTLLLLILLTLSLACSKKEPPDTKAITKKLKKAIISEPNLSEKIPEDSLAFFIADIKNKEFYDYSRKFVEKNEFAYLINEDSGTSKAAAFITGDNKSDLKGAVYLYSEKANYFTSNLEKLKKSLSEKKLCANTNQHYLIISNNQDLCKSFLSKKGKHSGFNYEKEESKKVFNKLKRRNEFMHGFADIAKLVQMFPQLNLVNTKYKPLLNLIPQTAAFSAGRDQHSFANLALNIPESSLPADLKKAFQADKSGKRIISKESMLALDINLNFFIGIFNYLKEILPKEDTQQATKFLSEFPDIPQGTVSLAVSNINITGFPDLQLIIPSSNPSETIENIKTVLSHQTHNQGLNLEWQNRDIAGINTDYITTPFGMGLFLNQYQGAVYLSSSELLLAGNLQIQDSLEQKIIREFSNSQTPSIFSLYMNYREIYKTLTNLKNMFSMLIPPKQKKDANNFFDAIDYLKNMDSSFLNTSYQDDILNLAFVRSNTNPPNAAKR